MSIGTIIYGPRYIGKTSFIEQVCDYIWDSGIYVHSGGWKQFKRDCETEEANLTVGIDGIGDMFALCVEYICEQENEEHPSTSGNRKPLLWEKIKGEMRDVLFTLSDKVDHLYFTADMETKNLDSSLYKGTMMYPKLDWVLEDIMPHITQQTIAMVPTYKSVKRVSKATGEITYVRKEKRVMICSARPDIYAGDSTGLLPKEFDAGESGEEAFNTYNSYMKKDK